MAARPLTKTQTFTLVSVLCSIFLAALDQTIVATAAPKIARDLQSFEAISWIFSSYMLASTVMIPIYGKLSDIYGRRIFYLSGIIVFLAGSILCGAAFSMPVFIIARVIQGLGAGAIMVESFTIIGDLFPPAERGKWQGLISSIFGLASIIGPLLGGVLADYASWRLVFFINVPIGALALFLVQRHFPSALKKGSKQPINYLSAVLLAITLLALLFGLVQSEHQGRWLSTDIAALYLVAALSLVAFVVRDRRSPNPIFPPVLFANRIFNLSIASIFVLNFCMFGVISYMPLYAQMALRESPSASGLTLIPFVVAMTIAAGIAGQVVSRLGKYKLVLVIGVGAVMLGMYMLSHMSLATSSIALGVNLIFVGAGIGITMPIYLVIVQSSFAHEQLGIVTSSTQLIRNLGSTIGTALLGTVIITYVEQHVRALAPSSTTTTFSMSTFSQLLSSIEASTHDDQAMLMVRQSFADATSLVISCCLALTVLAFIMACMMPVIPLRKTNRPIIGE